MTQGCTECAFASGAGLWPWYGINRYTCMYLSFGLGGEERERPWDLFGVEMQAQSLPEF